MLHGVNGWELIEFDEAFELESGERVKLFKYQNEETGEVETWLRSPDWRRRGPTTPVVKVRRLPR